jgi:hypothetical protein
LIAELAPGSSGPTTIIGGSRGAIRRDLVPVRLIGGQVRVLPHADDLVMH